MRVLISALADKLIRMRYPDLVDSLDLPSHLTTRERLRLRQLAGAQVKSAVEIGSFLGASAAAMAAGIALSRSGGRIFCIDTWENDAMTAGRRDTMAEFTRNTRKFADFIRPVRGWSTDPLVVATIKREAETIDLLFIDGDHSYEGVLADWTTYSPLLSPNAIVIMHDIGWAEGVQRVVDEEIRPRTSEGGRLPNLWWGRLTR